jgi:hypothetical protein
MSGCPPIAIRDPFTLGYDDERVINLIKPIPQRPGALADGDDGARHIFLDHVAHKPLGRAGGEGYAVDRFELLAHVRILRGNGDPQIMQMKASIRCAA